MLQVPPKRGEKTHRIILQKSEYIIFKIFKLSTFFNGERFDQGLALFILVSWLSHCVQVQVDTLTLSKYPSFFLNYLLNTVPNPLDSIPDISEAVSSSLLLLQPGWGPPHSFYSSTPQISQTSLPL